MYRACPRCAALDIRDDHDWELIDNRDADDYDPSCRRYRCLRCAAEEIEPYEHL